MRLQWWNRRWIKATALAASGTVIVAGLATPTVAFTASAAELADARLNAAANAVKPVADHPLPRARIGPDPDHGPAPTYPATTWPKAGTADVTLTPGHQTRAGDLPIQLDLLTTPAASPPPPQSPPPTAPHTPSSADQPGPAPSAQPSAQRKAHQPHEVAPRRAAAEPNLRLGHLAHSSQPNPAAGQRRNHPAQQPGRATDLVTPSPSPAASQSNTPSATPSTTPSLSLSPASSPTASTPVTSPTPAAGNVRVRVEVLDQRAVGRVGGEGLAFRLWRIDGVTTPAPVRITLDYSGFAHAFGANFGDRLHLTRLPSCLLQATTPAQIAAVCGATPTTPAYVTVTNDTTRYHLTGQVDLTPPPTTSTAQGQRGGTGKAGTDPGVYVVASSGQGSETGDFRATDLRPASSWTGGGQSGDFSYSYPLVLPPSPVGTTPSLGLSYDAQSVDGRTSATNNQASWVGMGWSLEPSYIERHYVSCSEDGEKGKPDAAELCWKSPTSADQDSWYTISLNGHSTELIRDVKTGQWHARDDQGWKIIKDETPGEKERWRVVTPDGTRFHFGWVANARWQVPVVGNNEGEPCHDQPHRICDQVWRWNLNDAVDRNNNKTVYTYATETNKYYSFPQQESVSYTRGGYLKQIAYGGHPNVAADLPVHVDFHTTYRCRNADCDTPPDHDDQHLFPDVPVDQICTGDCKPASQASPTFFITSRLASIDTSVNVGGWKPVSHLRADVAFPGNGDDTDPALWLDHLQRSGTWHEGAHPADAWLPLVNFDGQNFRNRIGKNLPEKQRLSFHRLTRIYTELGGRTDIAYGHQSAATTCDDAYLAKFPPHDEDAWYKNNRDCFRDYFTPLGADGKPGTATWGAFHKYVVTQVTDSDLVGGSPPVTTRYTYLGQPAWHFDQNQLALLAHKSWSDWRGYTTVQTTVGDGRDGPQTVTATSYYRGMSSDHRPDGIPPVIVHVTDYDGNQTVDHNWLNGQQLQQRHYTDPARTRELASSRYTYWDNGAKPTAEGPPGHAAYMVRPADTYTRAVKLDATWRTGHASQSGYTVANAGLPARHAETWDTSAGTVKSAAETCTTTSYAQHNSTTSDVYLMDFRHETITHPGGGTPGSATACADPAVIAHTAIGYDGQAPGTPPTKGNPTLVDTYTGQTGTPVITTKTGYDSYGRAVSHTDGNNHETTTVYSPASGIPGKVTTTGPAPHRLTTATAPNPAFGTPRESWDPAGNRTLREVDGLGRLLKIWLPTEPDEGGAGTPSYGFAYRTATDPGTHQANAPAHITTSRLQSGDDNGAVWLTSHAFLDGQGRTRTVDMSSPAHPTQRATTLTRYDSRGMTAATSAPIYNTAPSGSGLFNPSWADVPSYTITTRDALTRTTATALWSGGSYKWATTIRPYADVTITHPPGGGDTASWTDGHSNQIKLQDNYPTRAQVGPPLDMATTRYTHDNLDRLTGVIDPRGSATSYHYDWLGRRTTSNDPDTGDTTYTYDNNSNLTDTTDAKHTHLHTTYDNDNRKLELDATPNSGTKTTVATWAYDTATGGKGRLTSATSISGGRHYTTTITGYDQRGRPTGKTVSIPAGEGIPAALALAYGYGYDLADHPTSISYPATGDLPAETVTTHYTPTGQPATLTGNPGGTGQTYVANTAYTPTGQLAGRAYGPAAAGQPSMTRTYTWDPATLRLDSITSHATVSAAPASGSRLADTDLTSINSIANEAEADTSGNVADGPAGVITGNGGGRAVTRQIQADSYTWDPAGNLTSITDTATPLPGGNHQSECFGYDQFPRLTAAWTTTQSCATGTRGADTSTTGGPAPYNQRYAYDLSGNITTTTSIDTNTGQHTKRTHTYPKAADHHPHAVTTITQTGTATAATTNNYTWDANGDLTSRTIGIDSAANPVAEKLTWNPSGQLTTVTAASATSRHSDTPVTSYIYDADGNRLIRHDHTPGPQNGTTLYLDGQELHYPSAGGSPTAIRYYGVAGSTVALRGKQGITYLTADQQASTQIALAPTGQIARQRYHPYGAIRGTHTITTTDHAWLGKPHDQATDLNQLGARYQDPTTGTFISPDPLAIHTTTQSNNPYTYANNNPATFNDPSGLICSEGSFPVPCGTGTHESRCGAYGGTTGCFTQTQDNQMHDELAARYGGGGFVGVNQYLNTFNPPPSQQARPPHDPLMAAAMNNPQITYCQHHLDDPSCSMQGSGNHSTGGGLWNWYRDRVCENNSTACAHWPFASAAAGWPRQLEGNCLDCAQRIQARIGGEITHITPKSGVARSLGPSTYDPYGTWTNHYAVVQDGRVYDGTTGPNGLTIEAYRNQWIYKDGINFGAIDPPEPPVVEPPIEEPPP